MPSTIEIKDLPARLDELVSWTASGREVVLTEDGIPLARVVPCIAPTRERIPGLHPGAIVPTVDFDEPLGDEFWSGNR